MDDFKVPSIIPQKAEATCPKAGKPAEEKASAKPAISTCPYREPAWSGLPPADVQYKWEVLKSGQIIETINDLQNKTHWKFGRLPENDIEMAHPTISRFHAVLQYRPGTASNPGSEDEESEEGAAAATAKPAEGWYIFDLGSTHGTFLNKQRVPAKVYVRLRVGHMLRLGASTRSYILQGPSEDEEPESEMTVTELKEQRLQKEADAIAEKVRRAAETEERQRSEGISWGMAEDADEATDLSHNPYASSANEELFLDDPKKTLRGFYEREGLTLEYKCDEMSAGSFVCRVELPLDDDLGRPIVAEVVHKGKKKECVVQCALEACRILDRHGVLRQANQEPMKRKNASKGSDSEDDEFWDRTGDVARKKQRKATGNTTATYTHEDLIKQSADLREQLAKNEADIARYHETEKRLKVLRADQEKNSDDLDSFMDTLANDTELDKTEIRRLRLEQQRLRAEQQKVQRLIKLTEPLNVTVEGSATALDDAAAGNKAEVPKRQMPMIGKRNQFSKFKVAKAPPHKPTKSHVSDDEEFEEETEESQAPKQHIETGDKPKVTESEKIVPDNETQKDDKHSKQEDRLVELKKVDKDDKNKEDEVLMAESDNSKNRQEESTKDGETAKKLYGPAVIPPVEKLRELSDVSKEGEGDHVVEESIQKSTEQSTKKRTQRQRKRLKRTEIDEEELVEHESSEKYAKWVPPENQSGDGFTELNSKYGY